MAAVFRAQEVAELLGVSEWAIYEAVRREEAPIGLMAIRIGRRLVWPRAGIEQLLGIDSQEPEPAP
jgi:predicted DNA-binding transcriptional regulator AlpA